MKMASSQGGVGAVTALPNHHLSNGPHWNPGINQHQLHTARSLDRALEDAVCSGTLNLSGRKLRDYPGLCYDLTDTTQADMSKNRLTEIPPEVCLFAPLESLNLYHNCIKCIPETIINLQMLTYLNISRNLLSTLPKYLFSLPLKVLVVSNNKLVSIPEEIGKAKELMELDISCNEIQVLPPQVGRLQALRELNIRRNCLHMLPEELADLPLTRLDFSCNKITEIPPVYRRLRQLQHIILDNNPMQSPPAQICLKGKVHIFKYLNIQTCRLNKKPDSLDLPSLGKRFLPQPLTDRYTLISYHTTTYTTDKTIDHMHHEWCVPLNYNDNWYNIYLKINDTGLTYYEVLMMSMSHAICFPYVVAAFCRSSRQEPSDPSFTMRRKMEHLREEMEQVGLLRQNLESRLKVLLPDDVGAALMDGVVLCHLANHIRPRSVASIHVPSPAVPKLSMAKCRRNVENFLDACKKLGVPQDKLCLPHHILEERGLVKVGMTVQALLDLPASKPTQLSAV
uniref:Calponin-homology (CH) domain-containing protein n=1 Tax=Oncorhynchus tshawytscha TaxID=74940 RepID=A0A8C8I1C2_ONCTS